MITKLHDSMLNSTQKKLIPVAILTWLEHAAKICVGTIALRISPKIARAMAHL